MNQVTVHLSRSSSAIRFVVLAPASPRCPGRPTRPKAVNTPMARMFNRVLGAAEDRTDTGGMSFDRNQMKAYLRRLGLAEDWWVGRDRVLTRAADKLMETLDTDWDGKVGWNEFEKLEGQLLQVLAPGAAREATLEELLQEAGSSCARPDGGQANGPITVNELKERLKKTLPEHTPYAEVIAELGARLVLDAAATEQRTRKVAEVHLDQKQCARAERQARLEGLAAELEDSRARSGAVFRALRRNRAEPRPTGSAWGRGPKSVGS